MLRAANLVAADATRQSSPKAMAKACGLTDSGPSSAPYDDEGETYLLIRQAFCAAFDELIKQVSLHPASFSIHMMLHCFLTRDGSHCVTGHARKAVYKAKAQRQGTILLHSMSPIESVKTPALKPPCSLHNFRGESCHVQTQGSMQSMVEELWAALADYVDRMHARQDVAFNDATVQFAITAEVGCPSP